MPLKINKRRYEASIATPEIAPTVWTREGREVIQATVTALGKRYYQVEFVDSASNVLSVLRLSEDALLNLAGTSRILAEEVERRKG